MVRAFLDQTAPAIDAHLRAELERVLQAPDEEDWAFTQEYAHTPACARLGEAMRYAVLGPGKRLRPALAVASCAAVGGALAAALPVAAALEMLHAYTLVHDDLPAMDDDDTRRGQPSVHVAFDEATAILVGDALLTAAFGALATLGARAGDAVAVLARRTGAVELLGGQAMDLSFAQRAREVQRQDEIGFDELEQMHWRKTGSLFSAAAELGGIAGSASRSQQRALARYGMNIGIAFQYADDRDDGEHTRHASRARQRMRELADDAARIAREFGERGQILGAWAAWMGGVA